MIPNTLNVEEFATTLKTQAEEAFPPELPVEVKDFVLQVVYEFIIIAGNALAGEEYSYDENETTLICQLVGEWMYHKGIDNYKNDIPPEYWRQILQQIAFAIFEAAKKGIVDGLDVDTIIPMAENAVTGAYKMCVEQLAAENLLTKPVDAILKQSNLNDYVEQRNQEITPEQQERDKKLMTMALFFKTLTPEEVGKMIKMLDADARRQILTYMEMPDLERVVDPVIYNQYLEKFHNFMPQVQVQKRKNVIIAKINKAIENVSREDFEKAFAFERTNVKNFLLRVYDGKMYKENLFSDELTNAIVEYATQKVSK